MTTQFASLAELKPNPQWAKLPLFSRKNWTRVRFGDVVRLLKEQVDPVADGVERYVAGDHMESDNVHMRRAPGPKRTPPRPPQVQAPHRPRSV